MSESNINEEILHLKFLPSYILSELNENNNSNSVINKEPMVSNFNQFKPFNIAYT